MLFAFKRSKIAAAMVLLFSVVLIVLIWIRDQGRELYIPIVASVLVIGIGITAARIIGNILASMENTRYLGYLHQELDPEKFLKYYETVPGRIKEGSRDQKIVLSYLSDGYFAKGDFEKALAVLPGEISKEDPALYGLFATKRANCLLELGRLEEAEKALLDLKNILYACQQKNASLGQNMKENYLVGQEHLNALKHQNVDRAYLEQVFEKAGYNLRRLEIASILNELNHYYKKGSSSSQKMIEYLKKESGKTFYSTLEIFE